MGPSPSAAHLLCGRTMIFFFFFMTRRHTRLLAVALLGALFLCCHAQAETEKGEFLLLRGCSAGAGPETHHETDSSPLDAARRLREVCYSLWRSYDRSEAQTLGLASRPSPPLLRDTQPLHKNPYCGDNFLAEGVRDPVA